MDIILGPTFYLSQGGRPAYDQTLHRDGRVRPSASLEVTLSNIAHNEMKSRVNSLISHFQNVTGPGLRLGIEAVLGGRIISVESRAVEEARRHMGPSVACYEAIDWASFERYETRKTVADSTALGGELNLALAMYEDLLPTASYLMVSWLPLPIRPTGREASYALRLLEADLRMTKAHIHYKLRDRAAFKTNTMHDSEILNCYRAIHCDFTQQPGTVRWLTYLIAMAHLDGDVVDMPLRCVDLRRTSNFARKPRYFVGWWDLKALSQTSEDFRTTKNRLLMERGLPLAPFT